MKKIMDWMQALGKVARWTFVGGMCIAWLTGCGSLPPLDQRPDSKALDPTASAATALGRTLAPEIAAHPGHSGIFPLPEAQDAFAARVLLARTAERTPAPGAAPAPACMPRPSRWIASGCSSARSTSIRARST